MSAERRRRWPLVLAIALVSLVLAAIVARVQLPGLVLDRYHRISARMGEDYRGLAGGVDVFPFEGRYRLRDVRVVRIDGAIETPLVAVDFVDVQMRPLRGESVVRVNGVRLHLVGGPGKHTQLGEGVPWRHFLESLAPGTRVQRVEFSDTRLRFHQANRRRLVIALDNLHGAIDGLASDSADLEAEGLLMAHAPLRLHATFDPHGPIDALRLRARAHEVELPKLNAFARQWARIDFNEGDGEFALAIDYEPPRVHGAAAASLSNVDVFDLQQDVGHKRGLLSAVRELFAGASVALMKEPDSRRIEREFAIDARLQAVPEDNFEGLHAVLRAAFTDLGRHLPE